jgi:hypothetical protein
MLSRGYGLTNIVARMTKSSADLARNELMEGGGRLRLLLAEYGLQESQLVPGLKEFVAPNPSGRSTIPLQEKIRILRELKELLD